MPGQSAEDVLILLDDLSHANHLPYLLVGGNAVNAHYYLRTTFDIDIAIPESDKMKWRQLLENAGYEMFFGTPAFNRYRLPNMEIQIPLDLMLLANATFQKMADASEMKPLLNRNVHVPNVMHVLAMKLHALQQPHRMEKSNDFNDVIALILSSNLDRNSDEWNDVVSKYANEETRQKIDAHFRGNT
jgi:hypothetical protein